MVVWDGLFMHTPDLFEGCGPKACSTSAKEKNCQVCLTSQDGCGRQQKLRMAIENFPNWSAPDVTRVVDDLR